ncbi:MAG: phosphotransferase [Tetrasphaera sp.]
MSSRLARRPVSPSTPERAAHAAAAALGVDPSTLARQAQGSTSAVFAGAQVVLIVAPAYADLAAVSAKVALAAALAERCAFVRPLWSGPQRFAGALVSAWERIPVVEPVDWEAAGAAVRSLHAVAVDDLEQSVPIRLPTVVDCADIVTGIERLTATGRVRPRMAATLAAVARRLDGELGDTDPRRGVVHGDLHRPNLLTGPARVVLCDTDEIAVGSPAYDLGFLTDPARPSLPEAGRRAFESGYRGPLPSTGHARSLARAAHLRRTVAVLERPAGPRERYFNAARLGAWSAMLADWDLDLVPVVVQPRARQAALAARGFTGLGR